MTKQQALDQLRIMQAWHEDFGNGPNADYDAICYAIGVIEAQPHTYRGVTLNDVMMYFDSLARNEDEWTEFCSCLECRGWGLYHIQSATDKNVGSNDDCISRKQAIDALDVLCQQHRYKIPWKRETYSQYNEAWQDALDRAEGAIGNLPPAQPKRMRATWISKVALQDGQITLMDYKCSNCSHHRGKPMNFCEVCGAKMER